MKSRRMPSTDWLRTIMHEFTKPPHFIDEMYQAWQPEQGEARSASQPSHKGKVVPASMAQTAVRDNPAAPWRSVLAQTGIPPLVVSKYGWRVKSAERYGRVAKLETAKHTFAVKQADISADRIQFIQESLEYAQRQGFSQLSPIVLTEGDEACVTLRGHTYYSSRWIDGQPVQFTNDRHIGKVAQALARFNERTRGFQPSMAAPPVQFNLKKLMKQRSNDLHTLLVEAERRPLPGRFEEILKTMGDTLRSDAEASVTAISDPACESFLTNEQKRPGLSHLDVIPSNFVMDASGRVHLIDFDLMTFAPRALDLSHLMRRCLQLQSWSSETAYICFLQYNAIRTMTAAEYEIVHALLTFPYKAWRLMHTRYRQFEEPEQVRWLELYLEQDPKRQTFLKSFEKQIVRK
jgi:CotS family spore coat protein